MAKVLARLKLDLEGLGYVGLPKSKEGSPRKLDFEDLKTLEFFQEIEIPDDCVDAEGTPTEDAIEYVETWLMEHTDIWSQKPPDTLPDVCK